MTPTVSTPGADQRRYVQTLTRLLTREDLSDFCALVILADGIEGQLSAIYSDREAHDRIRDLARRLDGGHLNVGPEIAGERGPFVAVEAVGTVNGVPVRLWTHLHDPRAREEARR